MVAARKSPSSGRKLLLFNMLLILLIAGTTAWFFLVKQPASQFKTQTSTAINPASTSGPAGQLPAGSQLQEIADIQTQLDREKARAEQVREKIRLHQQQSAQQQPTQQQGTATASANNPAPQTDPVLAVDEQKQRIAEMIDAQLKGTKENQRLSLALQQKDRELTAIRQQNSELQTKLNKLDNSTQTLLAALVPGKDISASDQSYIQALQGGGKEQNTASPSANPDDVDLINRIEVSDSQDPGTLTATLRERIADLMKAEQSTQKPATPATQTAPTTQAVNGGDLQTDVNALLENSEERAAERQLQSDQQYFESLGQMEEERSNETRWVTVRSGDTLWIIANRVYGNGWLYPKIYTANPQILSSPDLIRTGQRLRVPF